MSRGKQSVKTGFWYIGGRKGKRRQKGGTIPIGLLASIGAPVLSQIAKPIFRKIIGRGRRRRRKREQKQC